MPYDRAHWEQLWQNALREHADKLSHRPPNAHLVAALASARSGRALDAGCGHGAESIWLAARGWEVVGVDFSASALAHARTTAEALGPELAARITWVEGDLAVWAPPPEYFDLVACLYVHIAGSVEEFVQRMASGVARRGTLFLVGHRPVDPATGKPTPAAGQVQVSVAQVVAALEPSEWHFAVAEERTRAAAGAGVDAVIQATRLS